MQSYQIALKEGDKYYKFNILLFDTLTGLKEYYKTLKTNKPHESILGKAFFEEKRGEIVGDLVFAKGHLSSSLIVHEITHAAHHLHEELGQSFITQEGEERFCQTVENLFIQTVGELQLKGHRI
jgi:hypothetical protein